MSQTCAHDPTGDDGAASGADDGGDWTAGDGHARGDWCACACGGSESDVSDARVSGAKPGDRDVGQDEEDVDQRCLA